MELEKAVELNPAAAEARESAIKALEGTGDPFLKTILKKLKKNPPSANLHWSSSKKKIVVIDMQ